MAKFKIFPVAPPLWLSPLLGTLVAGYCVHPPDFNTSQSEILTLFLALLENLLTFLGAVLKRVVKLLEQTLTGSVKRGEESVPTRRHQGALYSVTRRLTDHFNCLLKTHNQQR